MKNMIKMETGRRKGDVILLQQRERNKGVHTGDIALNESDMCLVIGFITAGVCVQPVKW